MDWINVENVAITVTFASAGAAMVLFLLQLALKKDLFKHLGMAGMGVALVGSITALVARGIVANHVPWSNLWESLIFMLAGTLIFYFIVEWWYKPRYFGVMAAPLVLVIIGGASILPPGLKAASPLMPALQSYWIKIHTSAILISYGAFTISFAASVAYFFFAWRQKQALLKTAPAVGVAEAIAEPELVGVAAESTGGGGSDFVLTRVVDGPAKPALAAGGNEGPYGKELQFFDELSYRLILVGFPLLMFGIITGAMWANGAWGTYWSWDPKETWSLITWFVYAAYLHARISRDWVGQKAATLAVVGFVSMIITYIGVNYLSTGLHSYGFIK